MAGQHVSYGVYVTVVMYTSQLTADSAMWSYS